MPSTTTKLRRSHKKSRYGCRQCKGRHIKCDEHRPSCVNCSTAQLQCFYFERPSLLSPDVTPESIPSADGASLLSNGGMPWKSPATLQAPHNFAVNMLHMELLSHFLTATVYTLRAHPAPDAMIPFIVKHASSTPYLMHEILALAASHLSQLCPARRQFYQHVAADLQTKALSLFNTDVLVINNDNCVPKFIFSSFLGTHVLFNAISTSDRDVDFLDKYIQYIHIHRGVRAIASKSWEMLNKTELKPILLAAELSLQLRHDEIQDFDSLRTLFESSELSSSCIKECQDAIRDLRALFCAERSLREQGGTDVVFAWPLVISNEFTKLLQKRTPEALIILAHYAVLLLARRRIWIVGDAGRTLIETITLQLGSYWRELLVWPNEMLAMEAEI